VSPGAAGCTPSNKPYRMSRGDDNCYTFWDTPGLNEADDCTVSPQDAVHNLLDLVKDHGVNLLIYCIRGRLVNIIRVNYDLFWKIICMEKVPIVLVVTGLEGKPDMNEWWEENEKTVKKMKLVFAGHACVTSWKGKGNMYENAYKESAEKVWELVRKHSIPKPWRMTPGWPVQAKEKIVAYKARLAPRNIVVFGQTGVGKSSIINMLAGSSVANVSPGAAGCTSSNQSYRISHGDDNCYTLWDTPGLNEAEDGTVSPQDAVHSLLDLVKDHGINLLIYCIRGRLVDIIRVNYDLFWKIICMEEVPIVLVVTGLEGKPDMDEWWDENEETVNKMKLVFAGHACVTSWKGKGGMCEDAYKESAEKVWKLVRKHSTPKPWRMTPGWPVQAKEKFVAYEKIYKVRKFLELARSIFSF